MENTAKRILFVEDDPVVLRLYRQRLQREGFEIEHAEDGQAAIGKLPEVMPDAVVLDLMLPKCNGLEVLKFIRAHDALKATPVMVLSNVYMAEMAHKAMQAGANMGALKTECTPRKLADALMDLMGCPPLPANRNPFAPACPPGKSKKPGSPENHEAKAFLAAAAAAHAEEAALKAARQAFLAGAENDVAEIRQLCLSYLKTAGSPEGLSNLNELYRRVRFFNTRAALNGCTRMARLASALEALLFEIVSRPSYASPSVLQTIAQAVDCLEDLAREDETEPAEPDLKAKVLVVDDDPICNHMTVGALKRAHLNAVSVEDPAAALQLLQQNQFDLVLLDISMPAMSGFELCEKLRALPQYKTTPVIFVTVNGDFQNRAQSVLSGGNDLITKPASPLELALKTTMHLLLPQTQPGAVALPAVKPDPEILRMAAPPAPAPPTAAEPVPPPDTEEPLTMAPHDPEPANPATDAEAPAPAPVEPFDPENAASNPVFSAVESGSEELPDDLKQLLEELEASEAAGDAQGSEPGVTAEDETASAASPTAQSLEPFAAIAPASPSESEIAAAPSPFIEAEPQEPAAPPAAHAEPLFDHDAGGHPISEITHEAPAQNDTEITVIMKNQQLEPLEKIAQGTARIMFGDGQVNELQARLTRIALEHYGVQAAEPLEKTARRVARIMFGDKVVNELNVRLTQIALQHYSVGEIPNDHLANTESTGTSEPGTTPEPVLAQA